MPYMRRKAGELEARKDDLRGQHGREPTDEEHVEHVLRARDS